MLHQFRWNVLLMIFIWQSLQKKQLGLKLLSLIHVCCITKHSQLLGLETVVSDKLHQKPFRINSLVRNCCQWHVASQSIREQQFLTKVFIIIIWIRNYAQSIGWSMMCYIIRHSGTSVGLKCVANDFLCHKAFRITLGFATDVTYMLHHKPFTIIIWIDFFMIDKLQHKAF